ncbi:hypothetical protein [Myroides phaeus]|uniref:hypothetical protein n=1 Tax=Myroides phaeus TaxID=702745 RepID=UPI0013031A18|nr:hypothetical protein [Myroides phaeus]
MKEIIYFIVLSFSLLCFGLTSTNQNRGGVRGEVNSAVQFSTTKVSSEHIYKISQHPHVGIELELSEDTNTAEFIGLLIENALAYFFFNNVDYSPRGLPNGQNEQCAHLLQYRAKYILYHSFKLPIA